MAKTINGITNTATQSIDTLVALANTLAATISSEVVTVNTHASGALTTGNGYVSGVFGSSIAVGGEFRGGAINASANAVFSSNVVLSNTSDSIIVGTSTTNSTASKADKGQFGNLVFSYLAQNNIPFSNTVISDGSITTTGTSGQVVDAFGLTSYRTGEYLITVTDNDGTGFQTSKILGIHDGSMATITEYALLTTNNVLATFSSSTNATSFILTATPTVANATFRIIRTSQKV